jgi:alanine racemase
MKRPEAEQLRKWCNGTLLLHENTVSVEELVIDTRKVAEPEKALFIALKTNRRDGHGFIQQGYEKGIRNFLVSEDVDVQQYPASSFIKVNDTLHALQQIASGYRKQFDIPVIGIG